MANPSILYFSTTSAGAANGTTWADRAALFSAGNWATEITGFDFTADGLVAYVGPGSYTCSQLLQASAFTNAPTAANPLVLHACDSSGNQLSAPDENWTSDTPVWDLTDIPVIATTSNTSTVSLPNSILRLLKFTASGRNGNVIGGASAMDFCVVTNSTSNTAAVGINGPVRVSNCVIQMTGTAYDHAINYVIGLWSNVRIEGNASASSGNRRGLVHAVSSASAELITAFGHAGGGIVSTSTNTGHSMSLHRCTIVNNGGTGILGHNTAGQTQFYAIDRCMITGNGAYGINADASRIVSVQNRLRDNTSGNFNGLGNYPTDLGTYTTDSDDASEYVDATNGDYRIKNTATIWGMGFGVSEEGAAAAGGASSYTFVG